MRSFYYTDDASGVEVTLTAEDYGWTAKKPVRRPNGRRGGLGEHEPPPVGFSFFSVEFRSYFFDCIGTIVSSIDYPLRGSEMMDM